MRGVTCGIMNIIVRLDLFSPPPTFDRTNRQERASRADVIIRCKDVKVPTTRQAFARTAAV